MRVFFFSSVCAEPGFDVFMCPRLSRCQASNFEIEIVAERNIYEYNRIQSNNSYKWENYYTIQNELRIARMTEYENIIKKHDRQILRDLL